MTKGMLMHTLAEIFANINPITHWHKIRRPVYFIIICYVIWGWNPLPSDEEMIENFKTHRSDFEEAVRRYREYQFGNGKNESNWFKEGDTLDIFNRAGIHHIDDEVGIWLPNPYSVETAIKKEKILKELGEINARNRIEKNWDHQDFSSVMFFKKFSTLKIGPTKNPRTGNPETDSSVGYSQVTIFFGSIWKDYVYFPEAPKVENGWLLYPLQISSKEYSGATYHEKEGVATWRKNFRVFSSLNHFPFHWRRYECIYREIESQWYLRMCHGNNIFF